MDEVRPGDTRARILKTALELFAERGYQRTSLREIAERLRLTKAAILYHFPSKEHILTALSEPVLRDLEMVVEVAERLPSEQARWAVVEGWLDGLLAHRRLMGMMFHDLMLLGRDSAARRTVRLALRANELVAGPDAGLPERVRAAQAIAMVSDPVVFFPDVPLDELRALTLDGVRRLFGEPVVVEPRPTPARRRPGRPRALSAEKIGLARRMHATGSHTVEEIAAALGVSRATVYRHLNADGATL